MGTYNEIPPDREGKSRPRHGSPTFYKLLEEMAETHDKKSHDYASDSNPSGNYHFAGQLSLLFAHEARDAGFVGRIGEKLYRLANLESSGKTPKNENIEDTERDLCVIMTLWMADRRNRRAKYEIAKLNFKDYSNPLNKEVCDLIRLMPDFQVNEILEFIGWLREARNQRPE